MTIMLIPLLVRFRRTCLVLVLARNCDRVLICIGKEVNCLENAPKRRPISSAAGIRMVIRPFLRIVPNVVCIVTLAPLKLMLL